jgi:hypothetical protein
MKTSIFVILILGFLSFTIYTCEDTKENESLTLNGAVIDHSDCKSFKSTFDDSETPDSLTCVKYSYDPVNNTLSLQHINAGFNCCPESLYCSVKLVNDTILIQEFEKNALCNCCCLFDLNIELEGVDIGMYTIKFIEPYCYEEEELIFLVNFGYQNSGSFCLVRHFYPWNIFSSSS